MKTKNEADDLIKHLQSENWKKIKLPNRYGDEIFLERINLTEAKLVMKDHHHNWCRTICDQDGNITAIDPSGGPMISVGSKYDFGDGMMEITKIKNGGIFVLKRV